MSSRLLIVLLRQVLIYYIYLTNAKRYLINFLISYINLQVQLIWFELTY